MYYLLSDGKRTKQWNSKLENLKVGDQITGIGKNKRVYSITQKGAQKCLDTKSAIIAAQDYVRTAVLVQDLRKQSREASLLRSV